MERFVMHKSFVVSLMLSMFFYSCDSDTASNADAGIDGFEKDMSSPDVGPSDTDAIEDSGILDSGTDSSPDLSVDVNNGLVPDIMESKTLRLTRTLDDLEIPFTDFYYGKNADNSLRLEAMIEGTGSCPELGDPTPEATLIVASTVGDNLTGVLLDFKPYFESNGPTHPVFMTVDEITFSNVGDNLKMKLTGENRHEIDNDNDGTVDSIVSYFTFTGEVNAIYCPSLDE